MLKLNLEENKGVWIDGSAPEYSETAFAGGSFRIRVLPITRTMFVNAQRKHTTMKRGVERTDMIAANHTLFIACVQEWDGLADVNGQPLPCDTETKEKIAEQYMAFASATVDAALRAQQIEDDGKAVERGN